jgi:hypothetical protein
MPTCSFMDECGHMFYSALFSRSLSERMLGMSCLSTCFFSNSTDLLDILLHAVCTKSYGMGFSFCSSYADACS